MGKTETKIKRKINMLQSIIFHIYSMFFFLGRKIARKTKGKRSFDDIVADLIYDLTLQMFTLFIITSSNILLSEKTDLVDV